MNYLPASANAFSLPSGDQQLGQWSSTVWEGTNTQSLSMASSVLWSWPTSHHQPQPTQQQEQEQSQQPKFYGSDKTSSSSTSPTSQPRELTSPELDDEFGAEFKQSSFSFPSMYDDNNLMVDYGAANRFPMEKRPRQQRDYTETVAVDSSACVAQIVGKNGCKIKLLRAKYNIYIHTPVAGEEPVFIIKGRREDVMRVKQEILQTAQHFNQLKANKTAKIENIVNAVGSVCLKVHIPDRYVGLVVGRNGWFVKVLQARFNVHIETPKFEIRTHFTIYGPRQSVDETVKAIVEHISNKNNRIALNVQQIDSDCYIE